MLVRRIGYCFSLLQHLKVNAWCHFLTLCIPFMIVTLQRVPNIICGSLYHWIELNERESLLYIDIVNICFTFLSKSILRSTGCTLNGSWGIKLVSSAHSCSCLLCNVSFHIVIVLSYYYYYFLNWLIIKRYINLYYLLKFDPPRKLHWSSVILFIVNHKKV